MGSLNSHEFSYYVCSDSGIIMLLKSHLDSILYNERLTRGLDDAEARMLVEWLVERTEARPAADDCARGLVRARAIARFVSLWCYEGCYGAALQLAAAERFPWPLPTEPMEPCDLMHDILMWESEAPG